MKEFKGRLVAHQMKIGIVISKFNEMVGKSLLEGALDALSRFGIPTDQIAVAWTPGAFEIPLIAKQMALSGNYDGIICLGAVIRGATPHFEYVASQATSGIAQIGLEFNLPVLYAVLTTNTIEEAIERAGTKAGNKGYDAALAAIEMIDLMRQLKTPLTQKG